MPPHPKVEDNAKKVADSNNNYYRQKWQCKYCKAQFVVTYSDYKMLREHLREKHRTQYYASVFYVIQEEEDHLWTAAK